MPRSKRFFIVVAAILLLLPIKTYCGAPGALCAVPPGPTGGSATYYYEIEPLGVWLIELVARVNLPIYYTSGRTT